MVEAKAKGLQGQGHKILSLRCPRGRGQSSRTPIPWLFTARCYAESGYATSSVCSSLSNSTPYCRLLCASVWSIVFMVL